MKELVTLIKNKEFAKAKRFLKKALQTELQINGTDL